MLRYKQLREEKNYTLRQLEQELKTNKNTINRVEKGIVAAKADYLYNYAKFFNVSIEYLLGRTNIRNEKEVTNAIKEILVVNGFANEPLHEIKEILQKTLEIYRLPRECSRG